MVMEVVWTRPLLVWIYNTGAPRKGGARPGHLSNRHLHDCVITVDIARRLLQDSIKSDAGARLRVNTARDPHGVRAGHSVK